MQVKISLLYNQFLARTNVALTSRMPCNSPYIFNYLLEYLANWLFLGNFFPVLAPLCRRESARRVRFAHAWISGSYLVC